MSSKVVPVSKNFYFKQIRNPKFQDIKPFEFSINLLTQEQELLLQQTSTLSSREEKINQLKSELKPKLAKEAFKQFRCCWPDLLDNEIFGKVEDCIDLAILCHPFIPGSENDINEILKFIVFRNIVKLAIDDILTDCLNESSDDNGEEYEEIESDDLLSNLSYSMMVQFMPLCEAATRNKESLHEQANNFPKLDGTFGILMDLLLGQSHELDNPLFKKYGGNQGVSESNYKTGTNSALARILLTKEWFNQSKKCNYYSLDTYYSMVQHSEGALSNLGVDIMCYEGLQLTRYVKKDLLFKRLQSVYGQTIGLIVTIMNLHSDIESKQYWNNIILNQYFMLKKQQEITNGKKKAQTIQEIVDIILIKIEEGINDIELICKQLYKCFPDETENLSKYFHIMKCTVNGQLNYYYDKQQQ